MIYLKLCNLMYDESKEADPEKRKEAVKAYQESLKNALGLPELP